MSDSPHCIPGCEVILLPHNRLQIVNKPVLRTLDVGRITRIDGDTLVRFLYRGIFSSAGCSTLAFLFRVSWRASAALVCRS